MLFSILTFAQKLLKKNLAANVKSSFQKKYPIAKSIKWEKDGERYEVSFDHNKTDHSVLVDAQGNIIETEV